MRQPNAIMMGRQEIPSNSTQFWCVATRCRVITYVMAAVLPLLLLIVVARFDPELNDRRVLIGIRSSLARTKR
jgi:hypothetical protein